MEERFDNEDTSGDDLGASAEDGGRTPTPVAVAPSAPTSPDQGASGSSRADALEQPVAWARKWYIEGEEPKKQRNESGRLVWPNRFKFQHVTKARIFADDVPLYTKPSHNPSQR